MTRYEATVVSAYTGYLIGNTDDLYDYLSELIGRPIYTHEIPSVLKEYHREIKRDFVALEVEDEIKRQETSD
ncbi:MAG: hypothetical protein GX768_11215 [Chloroflexi bacterium]|nr:hypothetical protein [Chloroflexota bacterium]